MQARLRGMECEPVAQFILRQQVDLLETLQQAQGQLMRQIRAYCRADEQLAKDLGYVTSIPGIGMVIGMQLLARIGDWRQMKRGRELAALLGLAPWEHSTGTRVVRGGISRTGDRHLRCLLVEAAWTARKRDPELGAFYAHLASRNPQGKGSRKAVVAVARKMTLRIYRVLKDQRKYEIWPPAQAMASERI